MPVHRILSMEVSICLSLYKGANSRTAHLKKCALFSTGLLIFSVSYFWLQWLLFSLNAWFEIQILNGLDIKWNIYKAISRLLMLRKWTLLSWLYIVAVLCNPGKILLFLKINPLVIKLCFGSLVFLYKKFSWFFKDFLGGLSLFFSIFSNDLPR